MMLRVLIVISSLLLSGLEGALLGPDLLVDDASDYLVVTKGLTVDQRLLIDVTVPVQNERNSHAYFALGNVENTDFPLLGFDSMDPAVSSGGTCSSVPLRYRHLDLADALTFEVEPTSPETMTSLFPPNTTLTLGSLDASDMYPAIWQNESHVAYDSDPALKQHTTSIFTGVVAGEGLFLLPVGGGGQTIARGLHYEPLSLYEAATVSMDGLSVTYHLSIHLPSAQFHCQHVPGAILASHADGDPMTTVTSSDYTVALQYINTSNGPLGSVRLEHMVHARVFGQVNTVSSEEDPAEVVTFVFPRNEVSVQMHTRQRIEREPPANNGSQEARMRFSLAITYQSVGAGQILGPRLGHQEYAAGQALPRWEPHPTAGFGGIASAAIAEADAPCYGSQVVGILPDRRPTEYTQEPSLDFRSAFDAEWSGRHPSCPDGLSQANFAALSVMAVLSAGLVGTPVEQELAYSYCDCCHGPRQFTGCGLHPVCRDPRRAFCVDQHMGGQTLSVCRYVLEIETDLFELDPDGQTFGSRCPALDPTPSFQAGHHDLLLSAEGCTGLRGSLSTHTDDPGVCRPQTPALNRINVVVTKYAVPQAGIEDTPALPVGAFLLRNDELRPGLFPSLAGENWLSNDTEDSSGRTPFTPLLIPLEGSKRALDEMQHLLTESMCAQTPGDGPFVFGGAGEGGLPGEVDTHACDHHNVPYDFHDFPTAEAQPTPGDPSDACPIFAVLAKSALRARGSYLYLDMESVSIQPVRSAASSSSSQPPPLPALSKASLNAAGTNGSVISWTTFLASLTVQSRELRRRTTYQGDPYPDLPLDFAAKHAADERSLPWVQTGDTPPGKVAREQLSGTDGFCMNLGEVLEIYDSVFDVELEGPLATQATGFVVSAVVRYVHNDATTGRRLLESTGRRLSEEPSSDDGESSEASYDASSDLDDAPPEPHHHHHPHHHGEEVHCEEVAPGAWNTTARQSPHHHPASPRKVCTYNLSVVIGFPMLGIGKHARAHHRGHHHLRDLARERLGLQVHVKQGGAQAQSQSTSSANTKISTGARAGQITISPIITINQPAALTPGNDPHVHVLDVDSSQHHTVRFPDGSEAMYNPALPYSRRVTVYSPRSSGGGHYLGWSSQRTLSLLGVVALVLVVVLFVCCLVPGCVMTHHARRGFATYIMNKTEVSEKAKVVHVAGDSMKHTNVTKTVKKPTHAPALSAVAVHVAQPNHSHACVNGLPLSECSPHAACSRYCVRMLPSGQVQYSTGSGMNLDSLRA
jgi:hypothetical protein